MLTLLLLSSRFRAIARTVIVVLAVVLIWPVYLAMVPSRPHYTVRQMRLVDALSKEVAQWAGTLVMERDRAVFGIFQRDPFGTVSLPVREAVWRADCFDLIDRGFSEKLRERLRWTLPMYVLDKELLTLGLRCKARYALGGEVASFQDDSRKGQLRAHLVIWDVTLGSQVAQKDFVISDPPNSTNAPRETPARIHSIPITQKMFGWMVLCGLLPFLAAVRRSILTESSNLTRLVILLLLILLSGLAAYFLVVSDLEPFWSGAIMLCIVPLSALYHWKALAFLRENLQ